MSLTVKFILLGTAIFAIIFASIVFAITKYKIKKTRSEYRTKEAQKYDKVRKKDAIAERGEGLGELLWDLKDETKNPLDDIILEYIINTGIRNGYKTFKNIPENKYIEESIIKIGKIKLSSNSKEMIIIDNEKSSDINQDFDKEYKNINKNGLIFIVNAPKRGEIKRLLSYTKMSGIRREYVGISKGMIIVAK